MEIPAKWQVSEDKDIPYSRHQDWEQHPVGDGRDGGVGGDGGIGLSSKMISRQAPQFGGPCVWPYSVRQLQMWGLCGEIFLHAEQL